MNDRVICLRNNVGDLLPNAPVDLNHFDFERWLEGSDDDVTVATSELRHHLRFITCAKDIAINPILTDTAPLAYTGCADKDGNKMVVMHIGRYDQRGLEECRLISSSMFCIQQLGLMVQFAERVRAMENEQGVRMGIHLIYDFDHLQQRMTELMADLPYMYK